MESQAVQTSVLTTVLSCSDAQYIQKHFLGSSITPAHLPVVSSDFTLTYKLARKSLATIDSDASV